MMYSTSILALAASASAHMILNYPVPYGKPNNSPLEDSGADFPCKATGPESYTVTTMNQWNAGETKNVSFTGSAVHGGGSCQFSLTTDMAPTKDTQWKVIHSAEGGCPADAEGNLAGSADSHGAAQFALTLPSDLPSGQYTFAWSWLNKLGNREFYMNCAPVQVGSGSSKKRDVASVLGNLPDMFVANIPYEQCQTTQGQDFEYPNPGDSVVKGSNANLGSDLSGAGCASMTKMGAGAGTMGSPSEATGAPAASSGSEPAATSAVASVPAVSAPAATSAAASSPGGVFAPGASSAPAASAPAATSAVASAPAAAPTGNSSSGGSGVACDTDGALVCIGSDQFGICYQNMATPMAVAAGTKCENGAISKRSTRFPRAHLHRRHGSYAL